MSKASMRHRTIVKVLEDYPEDLSKDVLTGMAEAVWVTAYSKYADATPSAARPKPGQDWYDAWFEGDIPDVPPAAFQAADVIGKSIQSLNHLALGEIAWEARGHVNDKHGSCSVPRRSIGDFAQAIGRALARECMGDGNLLGFPHKVMSSFECSFDGQYLEWTPREPEKTGGRDLALATNPSGLTKKGERMYKAVERGYRAAGDARAKEIAARTVLSAAKHGSKGLVHNPGEDWYEIVRAGGDNTVIGHVQASWLGDAHDKAAKQFGPDIVPFVVGRKGLTPIGSPLWSGAKRNPSEDAPGVGALVVTPDDEVGRIVVIDGNEAQVIHEDRAEGRGPWYWGISQLLEPHEDAKREYLEAAARVGRKNPSGGAVSKPGKHGTLHRFAVTYSPGPGSVPLLWYTWAYDQEHALERFYGSDDGDWEVISVGRVTR